MPERWALCSPMRRQVGALRRPSMKERSPDTLPLAAEFPPASQAQWLALVETVLKGRPFEKLTARTYDALKIAPLAARAANAAPIVGREPGTEWQVLQRVDHPDPAAANAEALHDLDNGATGLSLVFAGAVGAYGYGLPPTADALARALDGVYLDCASIEIDLPSATEPIVAAMAKLIEDRGVAPDAVDIRFGLDPLGSAAFSGVMSAFWETMAPGLARTLRDLSERGLRGPFACADGRIVHNAGGSEAQELAFALAVAVAYLRALEAGGLSLDVARRMLFVRLAADADQFLTTAKFRAIRKLWGRIEEACGLAPAPLFVSGETAWRMVTRRDPYVNMLRVTVATFSAATGGANAVTVLPFTAAIGLPDRFARRVARNTQLILAEESHLAKVADPAAGSGAIESLTDQLCRAAWTLFQEIEAAGGIAGAAGSALLQAKVARVRAEREEAVAHRRDALTGASEFPLLSEISVATLDVAPAPCPEPRSGDAEGGWQCEPMRPIRLAEPFEALRDASDRMLAQTGTRPRIFLATLGKPSDFLARATFAANFFAVGGIEAVSAKDVAARSTLPLGEAANEIAALAAAFKASGAALACLCSTDAIYETDGAAAAESLKNAGARHIYLAGRPRALEAALTAAGVQEFVFVGCDALRTLRAARAIVSGSA
jgi:methylmalonyl-CoA mutase